MSRVNHTFQAAAILLLACGTAPSQTTFATITGRVTDPTGAVIPKAVVTATNVATNVSTTGQSNETGIYTIPQLNEGTYQVTAKAAGFREFRAKDVILEARAVRRIDVPLEVGSLESTMEVTGGAALIETETARISERMGDQVLRTLPLNSGLRGIYAFISLAPGVLQAGAGSSTIRYAGSRTNQQNFAIDGTSMVDGIGPTQVGPLANFIEWVDEVKIDMANNSAEFGTIGQVTMISKSGTNTLHGAGFDYYTTPWFRARNPFALVRTAGIQHLPGFNLGGPVFLPKVYDGRNKTFFYVDFEYNKGSPINQLINPTVPLPAWRTGDFSGLTGVTVYDPNSGQPFEGNRIPANRINPVAQKIQDLFFPLPNFGSTTVLQSQNYRESKLRPYDPSNYSTIRGDHHFSNRDSVFGRVNWDVGYNRPYTGNLPAIGQQYQVRHEHAATISYTHIFSPSLLNEARWGFALSNNDFYGPINGPDLTKSLGLTGLAPDLPNLPGILKVNWSGVGLAPLTQTDYNVPGFRTHVEEWQDQVRWFHNRHSFAFGGSLLRSEYDNIQVSANLYGNVTFSNLFTSGGRAGQGYPYADFLLGIPTSVARSFAPIVVHRNRWQYDFFALDDFKVSSHLTLNIGVRYAYHTPWSENNLLNSMFDIGSGKIVVEDGALSKISALFPKNYVGIVEASTLGLPGKTLIRGDKNNFAPRFGIAWRPWGTRTVFRAGWGIFHDVVPTQATTGGIPFVLSEPAYTNPAANPAVILPQVFPATGTSGPSTVALPNAINPNIRLAYSMQDNVTIEHQMGNTGLRLSYIGTNTRQGTWSYNYNSPVPDATPFILKPRPFPNFPAIPYLTNGAGHQYHSLTAMAERHLSQGLYFQGSWVWARDIYDLDPGQATENPFDRKRERAVSIDIPTHRVTTNWIYELPIGKGRPLFGSASRRLNLLLGGWEINGIYSYYSGQFLTPLWTGPDPTGTAFTTSTTPASVTVRPDQIGDPNTGAQTVQQWFNPAAFTAPQRGRFGTAAKGVIKGPSVSVLDAGVAKRINITERVKVRCEMTASNVLNHPNWSNPGTTDITQTANVGTISAVGGVNGGSTGDLPGPRSLRAGVRVTF